VTQEGQYDRPTAQEIFDDVLSSARDEIKRSTSALGFSAMAAGFGLGLSGLAVAATISILGPGRSAELVALLFYPIGFIAVIVGRQQLFTENTLYPVALILDERKWEHVRSTARLWAIVFAANIVGGALFALFVTKAGGVGPEISRELARLGEQAADHTWGHVFATAIVGGWLLALVAWLVTAAQWTIGHVAVIWILTFVVGIAGLAHSIATSVEIMASAMTGGVSFGAFLAWLAAATLGNVVGGITIVTVLNYAQVAAGERS
jgi:formate/nitrite transporter FocA (FNT family)